MKRAVISLALLLACTAMAAAGEEQSEVEYYRQLAEKQLAEMQADPEPVPAPVYYDDDKPANFFAVAPQYLHSRNEEDDGTGGGGDSRANGMAVRAAYSRALSDCFTFSLLYEYAFMKYDEDAKNADDTPEERERWRSHTVGVGGEFALGAFGRIIPSLAHSFERMDNESAGYVLEDEETNTTSLAVWWEKDLGIGENWSLTPYAGWNGRHRKSRDDGLLEENETRDWTHFVAGGLKLNYQNDCFGFSLRAGFSHRLGSGDSDNGGTRYGYGARALANGVMQYSRSANRDRTAGSVGAGVRYALGANADLGLAYDGFFGKDTSAHAGTLSFGFSF